MSDESMPPGAASEMIKRVAKAMKEMCARPLGNVPSLEPIRVGNLGDAWLPIAEVAIEAMREPTRGMIAEGEEADDYDDRARAETHYRAMIQAALK